MYLATKSKSCYGNVLGYCAKTSEYVYLHFGKEIWREKGTRELFEDLNDQRNGLKFLDHTEMCEKYPIYKKYAESCGSY